jgi:hypothetical protein
VFYVCAEGASAIEKRISGFLAAHKGCRITFPIF